MDGNNGIKILITGDICPTQQDEQYFIKGHLDHLIDEGIQELFKTSDYRICNLETVLTKRKNPIEKCGPALAASPESINILKALNINFAGLSNNHIMDYGENGALDTIGLLNNCGISYSGIGANIKEASKPFFVKLGLITLGIICCCEHEFSAARQDSFGAYAFDPLYTLDLIRETKSNCDFLLVLYHGGKELYRYPSPRLRQICMRCIECGAHAVICQHSHCIGSEQNYLGKKILYGQGNFIFNRKSNAFWDSGLIVTIEIRDENDIDIQYHPIVNINGIKCLASGESYSEILNEFYNRSIFNDDEAKIEGLYREYSFQKINDYYKVCLGSSFSSIIGKIWQKLFRKNYWRHCFKVEDIIKLENYINCEAHHELFITGLQEDRNMRKHGM